jgi:predicted glycosyltransferase
VGPAKLRQYPGLKEEYYLADFEPDASVLDDLGVDGARVVVVLRPPPDVSLYHRRSNKLYPALLDSLGRREDVHAVVVPRTEGSGGPSARWASRRCSSPTARWTPRASSPSPTSSSRRAGP